MRFCGSGGARPGRHSRAGRVPHVPLQVYRKHTNAIEAAEKAAKGESKGFFSSLWG